MYFNFISIIVMHISQMQHQFYILFINIYFIPLHLCILEFLAINVIHSILKYMYVMHVLIGLENLIDYTVCTVQRTCTVNLDVKCN